MAGGAGAGGSGGRRVVEVVLPQLGESVAEGTVTEWLKAPGDAVEADEPLCEISTDKVNTDLPSPVAGEVVELVVEEGRTVEVGTVLARIAAEAVAGEGGAGGGEAEPAAGDRLHFEDSSISLWGGGGADGAAATGEDAAGGADGDASESAQAEESAEADTGATAADGPRRHSPAVRALARRQGVDLERVEGTGRGGRVTREDVGRHLEARAAGPGGRDGASERREAAGTSEAAGPAADQPAGRREPLSPVRRVIAERLSESKATIPHSTTVMEADLTTVAGLRERERGAFEAREDVPLTYLPFVAHATVRALEEHPRMNAVIEDEEIRFRPDVNLGVAVATAEGLLVPVVHGAEGLGFADLARAMRDAAADARDGRLRPDDVQGGTFTLTNHGRGGSLWGTPIIVPGQTGILGLGVVRDVPTFVDGAVEARRTCYLSLSFDHRTVDGAEADAFLRSIVERLASFDARVFGEGA